MLCPTTSCCSRDDNNKPVYDYLFRPSDHIDLPRLSKFTIAEYDLRPLVVSEAILHFLHWLTDGKYFHGLHAHRDIALTFFPNRRSITGVGQTAKANAPAEYLSLRRWIVRKPHCYPFIGVAPKNSVPPSARCSLSAKTNKLERSSPHGNGRVKVWTSPAHDFIEMGEFPSPLSCVHLCPAPPVSTHAPFQLPC